MANNLRYLLEHFCLDGQKIDISSQLDEENANNIEKINTQTVPSINARIDDIKNTDIPNINSRIDSIKNTDIPNINQKINTINNTTIPNVQASVNAVDEKADRINESVTKNTRDISTLSDNVTMQGNDINSINTEKIPSVENKVEIVAHETQRISKAHEHDIKGIGESLSTLHNETSNNASNIGNLTTSVNELTTKVNANTDSINDLTTKVGTNTDSINTINNTSIPHLQSEIDNLSGGGSGSVGELREKVEKNTADITELSEKVESNTTNISTLSGKVDTNTSDISSIKLHAWEKTIEQTSNGIHVEIFKAPNLPLVEIHATLSLPQSISGGLPITMRITGSKDIAPCHLTTAPVYHTNHIRPSINGYLFAYYENDDLIIGFTMNDYELKDTGEGTILYRY